MPDLVSVSIVMYAGKPVLMWRWSCSTRWFSLALD